MSVCSLCSVRTTCLVLGVLAMVASVSRELLKTYKGIAVRNQYRDIDHGGDLDLYFFLAYMGELMDVLEHFLCIGMVVATAFLIYVVIRKDDIFLLPLIWFLPLDFLGRLLFSLVLIINTGLAYPVSLTHMVPFFLVIILDVVFWLCVCSYRKQLISTNEKPPSCSDVMCYVKSSKTPFMI